MPNAQKPRLNRKTKKTAKYETMAKQREKVAFALKGQGLYLYQNNTKGTLTLPKKTDDGTPTIDVGGTWEGDDYYMGLVRTNMARLIREIISPEEERKQKMLNEEKLILDQPERVTCEGAVEQVVVQPQGIVPQPPVKNLKKKLNEQKPAETTEQNKEVLLTENPLEGVQILG